MSAILFGSISTVADTSELQREAFNQAFEAHGLGWHWDRDQYLGMLEGSGGRDRIARYASERGQEVDAEAVHRTKSELFQKALATSGVEPRAGVVDTIRQAKDRNLKLAFVTTTSPDNIAALFEAIQPAVARSDFDAVVSTADVERPKPDPGAYQLALRTLGEEPGDCVAIEDNLGGVRAADAAGVSCVAFPNHNTAGHDFGAAHQRVDRLDLDQLQGLIAGA